MTVCELIPIAVESRQHHVCGVQRVDEVWREGILLFNRVWPPEKGTEKPNKNTSALLNGTCVLMPSDVKRVV